MRASNQSQTTKALLFKFVLETLRNEGMTPAEIANMFSEPRVKDGYVILDDTKTR